MQHSIQSGDPRYARRSKTVSLRQLRAEKKGELLVIHYPDDIERPKCRRDCLYIPRPCPWISCRYNLYLDVLPHGAIKFNFPQLEPSEMIESCALDVAETGPHTLEEVGEILQVTRERIRQIWEIIRNKLIDNGVILRLADEHDIKKKPHKSEE